MGPMHMECYKDGVFFKPKLKWMMDQNNRMNKIKTVQEVQNQVVQTNVVDFD